MGNLLQGSYIDVHEAARSGHIDEVRRWVDEGKPVDAQDNTQKTPLHYAAQWGQEETLDFLIECGANVNAPDFIEDTPLHFACYFGHANCARILIMVGANVGAQDCYGNTPSQIFDDHVTEPVLDEIRSMVREVVRGQQQLAAAAGSTPTRSIALSDRRSSGSLCLVPTSPLHSPMHAQRSGMGRRVTDPPCTPSDGPREEQRRSDQKLENHDQQQQQKEGQDKRGSMADGRGNAAMEGPPESPLPRATSDPSDRPQAAETLAPRLNLNFPTGETLGQAEGGAGGTWPGPRPSSAPQSSATAMHMMANTQNSFGASTYNLSSRGYSFANTSPGGGNLASTGTVKKGLGPKGESLAGTLVAYSTRPGGTLDVFAAARDGQVSVLKQALKNGESVDAEDESGLTALMWAAHAGRLSTAKYLMSQGAELARKDDATGFTALHFAAYYCRSSVVRIMVLAGADRRVTDNRGKVPGARYQPLSYFSYAGFRHRRLIKRYLAGDLNDGMDDKGKTMFPMNSPLEAYDEDHKPQYVRLGSGDNFAGNSDRESEEAESGRKSRHRSNSGPDGGVGGSGGRDSTRKSINNRRAPAKLARKAYVTMETMHSSMSTQPSGDADEQAAAEAAVAKAPGAGSGVHYYLRRSSTQAVAAKTGKKSSVDRGGREKKRSATRANSGADGGTAGSGINYYLRRASLQGTPWDDGRGGGGAAEANGGKDPGVGSTVADAMAMAVAAAASAAAAGSGGGRSVSTLGGDSDEHNTLDHAEAGKSNANSSSINVGGGSSSGGGRNGGQRGGGGGGGELPKDLQSGRRALGAPLNSGDEDLSSHRSRESRRRGGPSEFGEADSSRSVASSHGRESDNPSPELSRDRGEPKPRPRPRSKRFQQDRIVVGHPEGIGAVQVQQPRPGIRDAAARADETAAAHDPGHAPGLAGFSQRGASAPLNLEASDHEAGIDDGARLGQRRLSPVNGNPGRENRHNDEATGTAVVRAPLLRQSEEEDEIPLPSQLPEVPILPAAGAGMPGLPSGAPFPTAVTSPRGGDGGHGGDDNSSLVDEGGTPISLIPRSTVSNKVFDDPDRAELSACAPRPQGGTEAAAAALAGSADEAPDAEGYRGGAKARQTDRRQRGAGDSDGARPSRAGHLPPSTFHDQSAQGAAPAVVEDTLAAAVKLRGHGNSELLGANLEGEGAAKLPGYWEPPVVSTKTGEEGDSSFLDTGTVDSPSVSSVEGGALASEEGEENETTARKLEEEEEEEEEEAWRRRQRRRRRQQRKKDRKGEGKNSGGRSSSSRRREAASDGVGGGGGGGGSVDSHRPSLLGPAGSATLAPLKRTPLQLRMGSHDAPGVDVGENDVSGVLSTLGGDGDGGGGDGGGGGGRSVRGDGRPDLQL